MIRVIQKCYPGFSGLDQRIWFLLDDGSKHMTVSADPKCFGYSSNAGNSFRDLSQLFLINLQRLLTNVLNMYSKNSFEQS